jgi:ATP-dependent helicase/DNAse subunit B
VAELTLALPTVCEPLAPAVTTFVPFAATESFTDEQAPSAMPGPHGGGTKMFELQSTCPFRAFAQTRLLAKELRDAYSGPNYIERGQRIESVLQRVWDELKDWQTLQARSTELEFQQIIERAVDGAIREFIPQPGRWFDNYRKVERSRLTQLATNWLAMEVRRAPFVKVEHQLETEITVGGITVNARIDRIDHLPDGSIAVIDYKSGDGFSSRNWEPPRMDAPQLPLYAVAQAHGSVSAVAFGIARTNKCDLSGYARQSQQLGKDSRAVERDMTHLIESWRKELERVAAAYLAGDAAVNPKHSRKTCAWCHLGAMCRVKEQFATEVSTEVSDDE